MDGLLRIAYPQSHLPIRCILFPCFPPRPLHSDSTRSPFVVNPALTSFDSKQETGVPAVLM